MPPPQAAPTPASDAGLSEARRVRASAATPTGACNVPAIHNTSNPFSRDVDAAPNESKLVAYWLDHWPDTGPETAHPPQIKVSANEMETFILCQIANFHIHSQIRCNLPIWVPRGGCRGRLFFHLEHSNPCKLNCRHRAKTLFLDSPYPVRF